MKINKVENVRTFEYNMKILRNAHFIVHRSIVWIQRIFSTSATSLYSCSSSIFVIILSCKFHSRHFSSKTFLFCFFFVVCLCLHSHHAPSSLFLRSGQFRFRWISDFQPDEVMISSAYNTRIILPYSRSPHFLRLLWRVCLCFYSGGFFLRCCSPSVIDEMVQKLKMRFFFFPPRYYCYCFCCFCCCCWVSNKAKISRGEKRAI